MAAKAKISATSMFVRKPRVKHPDVHAKNKNSSNKTCKNYVKPYCGHGK